MALALGTAAIAQTAPAQPTAGKAASEPTAAQAALASGQVIEVDRKEKLLLLKHGPIQSLGMDAMTMEFRVTDGKLLQSLKPGDKVRFTAAWKNGDYEITRLEVVKRQSPKRAKAR